MHGAAHQQKAVNKLKESKIALFGVGGVGGFTAEALARCGAGHIDLIDKDKVSACKGNAPRAENKKYRKSQSALLKSRNNKTTPR